MELAIELYLEVSCKTDTRDYLEFAIELCVVVSCETDT